MPFEYVVEYVVHVDSDDIIRRIVVVVDVGAILSQMFGELAQADDFPEGAEAAFAEFEYVMSMRMDIIALNDHLPRSWNCPILHWLWTCPIRPLGSTSPDALPVARSCLRNVEMASRAGSPGPEGASR